MASDITVDPMRNLILTEYRKKRFEHKIVSARLKRSKYYIIMYLMYFLLF